MKSLKTASQILKHYVWWSYYVWWSLGIDSQDRENILKAMIVYAKYKSDLAYEKGYQVAINQMK